MQDRFTDQVVLVTGAARGMGLAHAEGFLGEGARVVLTDVLHAEGEAAAARLGERARYVPLDVREAAGWEKAVAVAEEEFGPVSVLVNNAAITGGPLTHAADIDPAAWRDVLDVNLYGSFLGIHTVAPSMRRAGGGAIVNISSVRGFSAAAGRSAYAASKWGLRGLTKAAALELGPDGIRVNSVHPGMTRTAMHADAGERYARLPISRVGESAEVTRMVLFVASAEASYSTGSEFIVDGGFLLDGL